MEENNKKMSYEELEQLVSQLGEQNNMLMAELRNRNTAMMFKRLDYLIEILKLHNLFDFDFIEQCVTEVKAAVNVTPTKESKEPKETPESKDTEEDAEA